TINEPRDLKVYRPKEGDEAGTKDWRPLRKGIADLHRRAEVSQQANDRYLESLATVEATTPLGEVLAPLGKPVAWHGRAVRARNPLGGEGARLLGPTPRGAFLLQGFRTRALQPLLLDKPPKDAAASRSRSAAVTRKLRLLRAHALIRKLPRSHRYVVTTRGQTVLTTLVAARQADAAKLAAAA